MAALWVKGSMAKQVSLLWSFAILGEFASRRTRGHVSLLYSLRLCPACRGADQLWHIRPGSAHNESKSFGAASVPNLHRRLTGNRSIQSAVLQNRFLHLNRCSKMSLHWRSLSALARDLKCWRSLDISLIWWCLWFVWLPIVAERGGFVGYLTNHYNYHSWEHHRHPYIYPVHCMAVQYLSKCFTITKLLY